jgi:hypothetical protein
MRKQLSTYERFKHVLEDGQDINPDVVAYKEDPAKFLSVAFDALTEDLNQDHVKNQPFSKDWCIRRVLENEANHLLTEDSTNALPSGQAVTFTTLALPLVRKIFSRLLAMDLVSVQPISQPTAKVFYLDFQYHDQGSLANPDDSVFDVKDSTYSNNTENSGSVREIDLKVTSETISAVEKKLKAIWSVELEQDLQAYHQLAAETELMNILQTQIVREVDGLIIAALLAGATGTGSGTGTGAGNVNWDATGYLQGDTSTFERTSYKKTLFEAIVDASNLIYKKRYRYANWIIGHPDAIVRLEKLEEFKLSEDANFGDYTIGRHLIGTLNDRFRVYKDPFFPNTNQLLLGYKGESWSDAVGFYAPYIPLYMTPKIIDANDFKPRRGLMSRFAYGTLIKDGLATVTIQNAS